jgi:hypothetical protein
MKRIALFAVAVLMLTGLKAQNVQEITTQYGDFTVPAYTLTLKQDKDMVANAVTQRLKDAGVKTSKTGGYIAVLNQTFADIYSQPIDFYAKVEEQGKKKDRETVVTFFAKSPNLTISQNELNVNVRRFAENFSAYVNRYEASQNMGVEQKKLEKAQKNQAKAVAAAAAIDKDIAKDQEKIAKKQAEIAKYQEKIEKLNQDIEKLNSNIEKNKGKKGDADEKVNKANEAVQQSEGDVNRYRQQIGE